jgi:hypothetical protein
LGTPHPHPPTLLIAAIFSRHDQALDWARARVAASWGAILCTSQPFAFNETEYYQRLMGEGLRKQLLAVAGDFDPARLAAVKLESNAWECEYAALHNFAEARPLNIDPGYLTPMKIVLASTKDRAHRIYLHDGIYAEECLYYHNRGWQGRPWTYPDYLRPDYHAFFQQVRAQLQLRLSQPIADAQVPGGRGPTTAAQTNSDPTTSHLTTSDTTSDQVSATKENR